MLGNGATGVGKLIAGYKEFRRTTFPREKRLYQSLTANGQKPKVMMIACSDSRVSPTTILSAQPGDIFLARNVANIVPPYDPNPGPRSIGAAVEYAIKVLNITDIIVKGHARCGGVAALVNHGEGLPQTDYLKEWVGVAEPARALLPENFDSLTVDQKRRASEHAVIQNSIMNLSGYPWIRERLDAGKLKIHGWHFDMHEGLLDVLNHESGEWEPLA